MIIEKKKEMEEETLLHVKAVNGYVGIAEITHEKYGCKSVVFNINMTEY